MNPTTYPLTFEPLVKTRVWGGDRLFREFGRPPTQDNSPCGESWELVDLPEDSSVVAHGELRGVTLTQLVQKHSKWLMGESDLLDGRFPLLLKLLDARKKLSVQVHPDAQAAKHLGGRPKTEAWVVLDVEPGAILYLGLEEGITPKEVKLACEEGLLGELVNKVPIEPLDVVYIPAGTVHAIGAGLVLAELQQSSDTTYRLYDWGRMGLDGKPRKLHLREALESIHFGNHGTVAWKPRRGTGKIVDASAFRMDIFELKEGEMREVHLHKPVGAMCLSGEVTVCCGQGEVVLKKGGVCLSPAAAFESTYKAIVKGCSKLLVFWPN